MAAEKKRVLPALLETRVQPKISAGKVRSKGLAEGKCTHKRKIPRSMREASASGYCAHQGGDDFKSEEMAVGH